MVTNESRVTPRAWYARASRFVRASSSARDRVMPPHVRAARPGAAWASPWSTAPSGVSSLTRRSVHGRGHPLSPWES